MKDLDRFDKRNVVRRVDSRDSEPEYKASWIATIIRLIVVILVVAFFGWGMWELYQPADVWVTQHEISRTESDVRLIHKDAENARREMDAPPEITVESLIYQCMNNGYELNEDERTFIKNGWDKFLDGSKIVDPEGILFRIRMRYTNSGEIEDIPMDEWNQKKQELEQKREQDSRTEAVQSALAAEAQQMAEMDSQTNEKATKTGDKLKRKKYERRSNREIIRKTVEEATENIYSGDSLYEDAETPAENPDSEVTEDSSNENPSEEPTSEEPASEKPAEADSSNAQETKEQIKQN